MSALLIFGILAFQIYAHRFKMSFIPDRLTVTDTIYENEKNGGFGPGGNETGVRVYALAEQDAHRLIRANASLLDDQSIDQAMGTAKWNMGRGIARP